MNGVAVNSSVFARQIFDAILYFALEEGMQGLPNSEGGLLFPMARSVVEYLGGNVEQMIALEFLKVSGDNWSSTMNKEVELVLENNPKHFSSFLAAAIKNILHVEWEHYHGESWWESNIRHYLTFGQQGSSRTFYLTYPQVLRIKESIAKDIGSETTEHCRQIGTLMRKNIIQ